MRKIKLKNKPYCNELHFFLFGVVLLLLAIKHSIFYIIIGVYLFFLFRKTKLLIPMLTILIAVFLSYQFFTHQNKELAFGIYEGKYEVIDVEGDKIILKGKTKILIYGSHTEIKPGDYLYAKVRVSSFQEASYFGDFDSKSYYASKGITNRGSLLHYENKGTKWTIKRLKYEWILFYEKYLQEKSLSYVKTLFFGITDLDEEVKSSYSILYISHILTISGLHISVLYALFVYFFERIFHINGEHLALSFLAVYVLFIGCPISCLRAFLFLAIKSWNKKGSISYTSLDIYSITFIFLVIVFPLKAFQTSFILSFVISFVLLFMKEFITTQSKLIKSFLSSLLCICSILPFLVNQTNQISIIGIALSFALGYVFGKCILPIVLFILIYPNSSYERIFQGLDKLLIFFKDFSFPIRIASLSFWAIIGYYAIFIFVLICLARTKKIRSLWLVFVYLCMLLILRVANPFFKITFIDVGQGDSILIELPYQKGNVLIDCYTKTLNFLKSVGIRKLDYIILTHFDQDHMGSLEEIVDEIQVEHILYSKYEDIKKISHLSIDKRGVKSQDSFTLSETNFQVLGPIQQAKDANSNSIVIRLEAKEFRFLFTGDMSSVEEEDLINEYGKELKSDVLKVGHHGSSTSSSLDFLRLVRPEFSIISVGNNNTYGLPKQEVVERLNQISCVYMTKDRGNIEFRVGQKLTLYTFR